MENNNLETKARVKALVEQVFDTSGETWERRLCGRRKCQELILALEDFTNQKGFGNSETCQIGVECIPKIKRVYERLLSD